MSEQLIPRRRLAPSIKYLNRITRLLVLCAAYLAVITKIRRGTIKIHPFPEDSMNRLNWLAIIRGVYPSVSRTLDVAGMGICDLHFARNQRFNPKKQKNITKSRGAGNSADPCRKLLLEFKQLNTCCIPGCKNDDASTLASFLPAWTPYPQKVFRNFKLRHPTLSKICKAHLDPASQVPCIERLTTHRNVCLNTYLKDKLLSPRPRDYIQPMYASTPLKNGGPRPKYENPKSLITDTILGQQAQDAVYDFSNCSARDATVSPEVSPAKKIRVI